MLSLSFFVFGAERSGAALLARLISAHPAAYVLEEAGLYDAFADAWSAREQEGLARQLGATRGRAPAAQLLRHVGPWRSQLPVLDGLPDGDQPVGVGLVREFVRQLRARYRRRAEEGADGGRFRAHLGRLDPRPWLEAARADALDVRGLLDAAHRSLLPDECEAASILGEKSWSHLLLAPWIGNLHPGAVRFTVVRHPVANVAAIRADFDGDLEAAIARYKSFHMARFQRLYDPSHGPVLRCEDLQRDPESVMAEVRATLGLLNFPLQPINTADLRLDPTRGRRAAVGSELTPRERAHILAECADIAARYYPNL
ncbi:MAG: hypothetical protein GC161_15155 [Planctomycetaceae bacterium]|nr:hypothetical protein [Planctomycetaceae bacterium]